MKYCECHIFANLITLLIFNLQKKKNIGKKQIFSHPVGSKNILIKQCD